MLHIRGLDFESSPEEIRDVYLITPVKRRELLRRISRESGADGLVLVMTCTRIECSTTGRPMPFETLERAFGFNHIASAGRRYAIDGDDAVTHLYEMSTGILSALYGEEMIMSQITDGIKASEKQGISNSYLSRLFSSVIAFARRERNLMKIRVFDRTVPEYIASTCNEGEKVLIIGSNEQARMTAEALLAKGCRVTMTLRDESKIFLLPPGTEMVSYDSRRDVISGFSVIVSSSSGLYHTLDETDRDLLKARLLYDLSVPYDIADGLRPVRLRDLPVEFPEREKVETGVRRDAAEETEKFRKAVGMKSLVDAAGDIAFDTVRRMFGVVSDLDISDGEKEKLLDAVRDSSRKAAISWFNREKRNG